MGEGFVVEFCKMFRTYFFFAVCYLSACCLPSRSNPGGPREEIVLEIEQTWAQEPNGYSRTAKVAIPATSAGQKVPVVFHFHGAGGQGNTHPFGHFLPECIIVAPDGYERTWNIYAEPSKADDVQFALALIEKISQEIPQADMDNVNIAGTSNGAALTYQILINTGADRPFKRALPMVSSLIGPQYHEDQFWKFAESADDGEPNDFSVAMVPTFADDFEYAHFHGTEDGSIKYEGQNPGPSFLNGAEVIAAQLTDYVWAKAMGFTGTQIADSDGVDVGTDSKPTQEFKYLDGRCRHYKLIGEGHGTGPNHPIAQQVMRDMILGGGGSSGSTPSPPTPSPPSPSPPGSTLPNPGGSSQELTLQIDQTWSQEPSGYTRTAKVAIPATSAGQKVPVVFHLHGNGGQGNTRPFGNFLGDDCIIVAPDGYERSWNVYSEKSKADDVQFILDLIAKIGAEIPEADMNNVNIA